MEYVGRTNFEDDVLRFDAWNSHKSPEHSVMDTECIAFGDDQVMALMEYGEVIWNFELGVRTEYLTSRSWENKTPSVDNIQRIYEHFTYDDAIASLKAFEVSALEDEDEDNKTECVNSNESAHLDLSNFIRMLKESSSQTIDRFNSGNDHISISMFDADDKLTCSWHWKTILNNQFCDVSVRRRSNSDGRSDFRRCFSTVGAEEAVGHAQAHRFRLAHNHFFANMADSNMADVRYTV